MSARWERGLVGWLGLKGARLGVHPGDCGDSRTARCRPLPVPFVRRSKSEDAFREVKWVSSSPPSPPRAKAEEGAPERRRRSRSPAAGPKQYKCSICRQPGHDRRSCPQRAAVGGE